MHSQRTVSRRQSSSTYPNSSGLTLSFNASVNWNQVWEVRPISTNGFSYAFRAFSTFAFGFSWRINATINAPYARISAEVDGSSGPSYSLEDMAVRSLSTSCLLREGHEKIFGLRTTPCSPDLGRANGWSPDSICHYFKPFRNASQGMVCMPTMRTRRK